MKALARCFLPSLLALSVACGRKATTDAIRAQQAPPVQLVPVSDSGQDLAAVRASIVEYEGRAKRVPITIQVGDSAAGLFVAQSDVMSQSVLVGANGEFVLELAEYSVTSNSWEIGNFSFQAAGSILALASRQPYEIYLAFQDSATSEFVVEQWVFAPQLGARTALRLSSLNPIGKALAYRAPSQSIVGGTYIPMAARSGSPTPTITEVYRGNAMTTLDGIQIDPDCRFLLLCSTTDATLHQVPLRGPQQGQAILIANSTNLPALALTSEAIPHHHVSEGRMYLFQTLQVAGFRSLLRDNNNDGVFDSAAVYSSSDWENAGYEDYANWRDTFTYYQ